MELYKVTTETIDEVVNKLPIQSVIRTPTIPNNLRDKLRNLIKGGRGIINGEQLRDLVFP